MDVYVSELAVGVYLNYVLELEKTSSSVTANNTTIIATCQTLALE